MVFCPVYRPVDDSSAFVHRRLGSTTGAAHRIGELAIRHTTTMRAAMAIGVKEMT